MLSFPAPVKIFLCGQPVDLRRSFDGLATIARDGLGHDPLSGDWFVFRNRRGDRLKILLWDQDGLLLIYKRLEEGHFRFPAVAPDATSVQVTTQELSLLLWGIDPASVVRQKRYARPPRRERPPAAGCRAVKRWARGASDRVFPVGFSGT